MPIVNRVADLQPDIQAWRRDIHEHPELLYDVHRTAAFVAERLREFGCDEVVDGARPHRRRRCHQGTQAGRQSDIRVIGLRADMDALPIEEATELPYASKTPGKMHACGHDGHTAMLLGAARYLAETRNFAGDAVVIFQPAEEGGAGAAAMIKDGLMDRFAIDQVYGMHNGPGIPIGRLRSGPVRSWPSTDAVDIRSRAAAGMRRVPHLCIDSVLVGAQLVTALQSIVSRSVDPLEFRRRLDVRIPRRQRAQRDTANRRAEGYRPHADARGADLVEKRVREVVEGVARMTGAKIDLDYRARLSGHGQPCRADRCRQQGGATKSPATATSTRCRR